MNAIFVLSLLTSFTSRVVRATECCRPEVRPPEVSEMSARRELAKIMDASEVMARERFSDSRVKESIGGLFLALRRGRVREVETSVEKIFTNIFVSHLESKKKRFSRDFQNCLSNLWPEFKQFSRFTQILTERVERAIRQSALLMRALSLATHALNISDHLSGEECCLSPFSALDNSWRRLVSKVKSLEVLRNSLFSVSSLLSSAEKSLETHVTSQQVRLGCGSPKRYLRSVDNSLSSSVETPTPPPLTAHILPMDFFSSVCPHARNTCLSENPRVISLIERLNKMFESLEEKESLSEGSGGHWDTLADDEDYHSDQEGSGSGSGPVLIPEEAPGGADHVTCSIVTSFASLVVIVWALN